MAYAQDIYGGKSDQELSMVKYDYAKLYTELYVGMPESDFVKLYDENKGLKEESKPRIIKHQKNQYFLQFIDGKARVTFEDSKLSKFKVQVWEGILLVYSDVTYALRGYEYFDGLYKGMPEYEFLSKFKERIVRKYEEGYYSIEDKNGILYGVTFLNGFLDDVWKN